MKKAVCLASVYSIEIWPYLAKFLELKGFKYHLVMGQFFLTKWGNKTRDYETCHCFLQNHH